jgi:Domain of unknown function (DUF222)
VTTQVSTAPTFTGLDEALAVLEAAMGYLSAADATAMPTETQAQVLRVLERATAMGTAARACILGAFTATRGYSADGDYSPRSWLIHRTQITRGAATAHTAWARRAAAHPRIAQALAAGEISESSARTVCAWTDKLRPECRDDADDILVTAARTGADLQTLATLAAEIYKRSLPEDSDDEGQAFEDRSVKLAATFEGAGVLNGELTPECAAVVTTVLDALSAPCGAEDDRSHAQRYHDALHEAMQRLLASDLLPDRAGQPVKAWAHVSLADLVALDGSSALLAQWTGNVRAQWAAARAGASVGGSDGAAWLDGDAAQAFTCDASITPIVTGEVNYQALDSLVRLCVELADLDRAGTTGEASASPQAAARSREALQLAIIGRAVDLLSGPGGLASFLRTRQLGARLAGPSLPLDVGVSRDIPAGIRAAVLQRARHCEWAGGCHQPAAACQIHHVRHKANGGETSVKSCVLLCFFHHQVCIHRWGWTLVLNPDGTTTAWNPGRTKVLHSHGPPQARAG